MHEYSIIASLIDMCESHAQANNADKIAKVRIGLGALSGVEAKLLQSAFEGFREQSSLCAEAMLEIEHQEVKLACLECKHQYTPKDLNLAQCPQCQSHKTSLIQGRELVLLSLELDVLQSP